MVDENDKKSARCASAGAPPAKHLLSSLRQTLLHSPT